MSILFTTIGFIAFICIPYGPTGIKSIHLYHKNHPKEAYSRALGAAIADGIITVIILCLILNSLEQDMNTLIHTPPPNIALITGSLFILIGILEWMDAIPKKGSFLQSFCITFIHIGNWILLGFFLTFWFKNIHAITSYIGALFFGCLISFLTLLCWHTAFILSKSIRKTSQQSNSFIKIKFPKKWVYIYKKMGVAITPLSFIFCGAYVIIDKGHIL